MLKKLWNDPVWSRVIASVIFVVGATIVTYFRKTIGRFIKRILEFIFSTTAVPNWLIGLLCLLSLLAILIICAFIWDRFHPSQTKELAWSKYTSDIFFGLRWRWSYSIYSGISNLCSFCPDCDYQIYQYDSCCDSCGKRFDQPYESRDTIEGKVERLIQQKLRNGTWIKQNQHIG
jgi:hypothetical protein